MWSWGTQFTFLSLSLPLSAEDMLGIFIPIISLNPYSLPRSHVRWLLVFPFYSWENTLTKINAWYISLDITSTYVQGWPLFPACRIHPTSPFPAPSERWSSFQALTHLNQLPIPSLPSTDNNRAPTQLGEKGFSWHLSKLAWWAAASCLVQLSSF